MELESFHAALVSSSKSLDDGFSSESPARTSSQDSSDTVSTGSPDSSGVNFYEIISDLALDDDTSPDAIMPTPPPMPQSIMSPTPASTSAYRAFQERSGCKLVFCDQTKRHVMVLPGAVPKPKGFTLGSQLYRKRCVEHERQPVENF